MNKIVVVIATALHLVPHPFGVSPVGAMALYAGALGAPRSGWAVPMLPLFGAGLLFGFYDPVVMAFVFGGIALSTFAGRWLLRGERGYRRFAAAILLGATVFFLVSNFAVWLVGMYPPTLAGLVACYVNGLPYLGQAMLVDAAFCFVLFGLHAALHRYKTARRPADSAIEEA